MADYPATPKPSYSFVENLEFKTNVFTAENGSEQFSSKWDKGRRSFSLVYKYQNADTIWDFFNAHKGKGISFTFDPHDFFPDKFSSELITCRFSDDKIGRTFDMLTYYMVSFTIQEVK